MINLSKAFVAAQAELKHAPKDSNNPHFKSRYASLQSIIDTAKPTLAKHGLAVAQTFEVSAGDVVTITTTLIHTSGESMKGSLTLKPDKPTPQGMGSAITYGRRYSLAAILGIVADEDDDGNAASPTPLSAETKTKIVTLGKAKPETEAAIKSFLANKGCKLSDLYEDEAQELLKSIQ